MQLDPKSQFLKFQPDAAKKLAEAVEQPFFQTSVNFALAELASSGATTDEMRGAGQIIAILGALGEPTAPIPKFPTKTLKTFEPEPPKPEKK